MLPVISYMLYPRYLYKRFGNFVLLVSELFLELSSCLRLPTEQTMDEQPQGRHVHPGMYSANQLVLTVENRDSMAFLAAVFTGESSMYTHDK